MAGKVKIGLVYSNNQNWIGGTYYLENLIHALKAIKDNHSFELILLSDKKDDYKRLKLEFKELRYKNPNRYARTIPGRLMNKLCLKFGFKPFIDHRLSNKDIDILFPANDTRVYDKIKGKVYWVPDFQEYYFPDFFSSEELALRKQFHEHIASNTFMLIVSSQNAKSDFFKFYPNAKCAVHVVNFAVSLPEFESLNIKSVKQKYNIKSNFFMCPNQFWQHKNHMVILKALSILKKEGVNCLVVFTGKEYDHRNPEYFNNLKQFVTENALEQNVRFLGFIDRKEQLKIMREAIAVIQPSLFEGWSTVVEDSKAISQYVLLSNIPVHKEQLNENVSFFNPTNEIELVEQMKNLIRLKPLLVKQDYNKNVVNFGLNFLNGVSIK